MKNKNKIKKAENKATQKNKVIKIRRITVLEKYLKEGYLELQNSKFSAEDRKKVGERLFLDYYCGGLYNLKTCWFEGLNIPETSDIGNESRLFYRERYLKAVSSVPYEFWPAVRSVCIEDKELKSPESENKKSIFGKYKVYCQKMMLNLGLERLIKFYLQKNKKSS